ncbi:transmembrane protein UsgS [Xylona heveae TC161]|uniref:Transmembrane protein UsgS n=1 Tax=Xylona heveae (strain CBS 132557 / TC161) TaxID=1328760 RepID=A0A165G8D9_XYLHT|nr:transmembrane protein UsgS [Xylona heveae TC161]KZF21863.1 transmembrane protein UsgS [Xylona heveae TC161]
MSNFDPNAIIRGAQLTIVGAYRALQNPALFKYEHYRQAALAVCAGVVIRLIIAIPLIGVRVLLWFLSLFVNFESTTWDNDIIDGMHFLEHSVLQIPFFLMSLMKYLTPTMDEMFMDSLQWVDKTYYQKHKSEDPKNLRATYYPNLRMYTAHGDPHKHKRPREAALKFLMQYSRKAAISLAIYFLSYTPVIGRFVLPAASFYTFNKAVGPVPAVAIFGSGLFLPKRYLIVFLQSYFASRSLMRELLSPYFSRIKFTSAQRRQWFHDREGLLFGFGVGFYLFLKIPLLGVLIYGIAEASTAYLVTKITDPPPPPAYSEKFAESQIRWSNKKEFLKLPLTDLDAHNAETGEDSEKAQEARRRIFNQGLPAKKFT